MSLLSLLATHVEELGDKGKLAARVLHEGGLFTSEQHFIRKLKEKESRLT